MANNSIQEATRYSDELDKVFTQSSATGFFADSALTTKFVGAKTVIIPDIDFQGLSSYDRANGFENGAITVSNTSYTMTMDRARSLQIDREDLDESGVANLAGKVLGEYVRTKVVPECDAYVLSKLGDIALAGGQILNDAITTPYATLCKLIQNVQSVVGYDEELVAFVDSSMYAQLQNSNELSRMMVVSDFKQGEVNLKVHSLNGVAIIPVVNDRMKTNCKINTSGEGGYCWKEDLSRDIYMMVCPKRGAHLVKKTEQLRVFTPEQNVGADAYKFDYRLYYDVFVGKQGKKAIWAWLAPDMEIATQPADVTKTAGSVSGSLSVSLEHASNRVTYQWYVGEEDDGSDAEPISGATSASYSLPTTLTAGDYYYFAKLTADGISTCCSDIAHVKIQAAG